MMRPYARSAQLMVRLRCDHEDTYWRSRRGRPLTALSAFMQAADAQQFRQPRPDDPERLRMISVCMEMNRKYNTDPFGRSGARSTCTMPAWPNRAIITKKRRVTPQPAVSSRRWRLSL